MHGSRRVLADHLDLLAALPAHGNTKLTRDQLILGLLLSFFEPLARSLRRIEICGDFQGRLKLPRLARATTSDALAAFDPALLEPLLKDLRQRVPNLAGADAQLQTIVRQIIAADGTYLTTMAEVAWALHHTKTNGRPQGQVRANVQLDVATWTPVVLTISGNDDESEPAAFAHDLLSGVLYVMDRNFVDFDFIKALLAKDNDLVLRIRSNAPVLRVMDDLPLTAADAQAGVIADQIVELTGCDAPEQRMRLVTVSSIDRKGKPQIIRLLTNLIDSGQIAAHLIGAIYRQRWQVELFFKWLKTWARMDHLLSTSRQGITTQLYVAVIGVLMICVQTGRRVSIYSLTALSRVASGQMTIRQAMEAIGRMERERDLERARQARCRARKKLA